MYEQYTDKQIVEMLIPKLRQAVPELEWSAIKDSPDFFSVTNKMIATIYRSAYIRGQLGRSFIIGEKKNKESVSSFKTGDKVKFLGLSEDEALVGSQFYPPVNTVGEVVEVLSPEFCFVQWPKGAIYSNGALSCPNCFLEKVTDEKVIEHWAPATKDNVKVGNKVRMIDGKAHNTDPAWFPVVGTLGITEKVGWNSCLIQWPEGTTYGKGKLWSNYKRLEVLLSEG